MKLTTQKSILSLLTATLFLASGCDHIEQPNEPDIVGYTETAQQAIENGLTVGAIRRGAPRAGGRVGS